MLDDCAHSIDNIVNKGTLSRSAVYNAIRSGALKAHKAGRRIVIMEEDYIAYLTSLPEVAPRTARKA